MQPYTPSASSRFQEHELRTQTSIDQINVESLVEELCKDLESVYVTFILLTFILVIQTALVRLYRKKHEKFLKQGLEGCGRAYQALDASRPWLVYWCVHGLALLNTDISDYKIR